MAENLIISLIIKAIDQATGPMRRVTNNFAHMRRGWQQASASFAKAAQMRQAAEGVASFARKARAAIAAPISAFEDFEAAMSGVRAVTRGITEKEFADLTDTASKLGATTRFTATQAAQAMKFLGMAGFNAAKQMAAVPATLDLATAAGTDLGRTADIVSDIMGAFNKTAKETRSVADMLAVTMTGANVNLETMFETMKLVGPIATKMKISMADVAAMTGLMGSAGIKGSMAGTALRGSILRLIDPSKKAAAFLEQLKVKTVDASGNMRPMIKILDEVAKASAGLGTAKQGAMIKEIFGLRAVSGVATLLDKIAKGEVQKFSAEIENSSGAVAEMARIMDDNARGATVRLTSAVDGLNIAVGSQLTPSLTSLKETMMGVIQGMTVWSKEHPDLTKAIGLTVGVVALLATGLAGLMFTMAAATTALGVMAIAFGSSQTGAQLMGGAIRGLIVRIGAMAAWIWATALPAMGAWAASLWATIAPALAAAAPFIAIAVAIGAITLAVALLIKHWKELDFLEGIKGIVDSLGADGVLSTIGQLFDPRTLLKEIGVIGPAAPAVAPIGGAGAGAGGGRMSGELSIKVETEPGTRASVTSMQGSGLDLTADTGLMLAGFKG